VNNLEFTENTAARHYEAKLEGNVVGFIEYRESNGARLLTHTEVSEKLEGQGVGSQLVKFALENIKASGSSLVPLCPFVAAYVGRHREYTDLVKPDHRGMYGL
jgi:uncharacterized protein